MPRLTLRAARQIEHAIPAARFQTYRQATEGVIEAAKLYLWNIQAASAVTELTGLAEVLLRETIDTRLKEWNTRVGGSEEWIVYPAP
jgi:Abi-like protein.